MSDHHDWADEVFSLNGLGFAIGRQSKQREQKESRDEALKRLLAQFGPQSSLQMPLYNVAALDSRPKLFVSSKFVTIEIILYFNAFRFSITANC